MKSSLSPDKSTEAIELLKGNIGQTLERGETGCPVPVDILESLIEKATNSEIVRVDPYASLAIDALNLYCQSSSFSGQRLINLPTEMLSKVIDMTEPSAPMNLHDAQNSALSV